MTRSNVRSFVRFAVGFFKLPDMSRPHTINNLGCNCQVCQVFKRSRDLRWIEDSESNIPNSLYLSDPIGLE